MADPRIEELRALLPQAMLPDWVRLGSRLVRLLRDQQHLTRHDEILNRLLVQARDSAALRRQRAAAVPRINYPPELPISARGAEIVSAIRDHQVVIIAGETGSGKTTQLPKMCLAAGLGIEAKIGCTQPRRVAALSISRRIAEELNVQWGREVGCKIRFDDRSSPETFIKLMTDGILLAETQGDPLLAEYNALIIDEAHERSLNIDFLLGYLKGLLAKRPELKLLITSATIDTQAFSAAFDGAPIIEVSGRVYPVEVIYAPLDAASEERGDETYIDAAVRAADQALLEPGGGDVLVFMPGERDIRETADQLKARLGAEAEIIPLFGRLSSGDQQRVFAPAPRRKIVVATNIAETSLTIPGIRYVIDSGLARVSRYNTRTRTRRLPIEPIAQSSANQRRGRSGRVQNGVCIRLYSEADFAARPAFTQPEIQRANLAEVILRMKAFRLGEIETFPFLNPPSPAAIQGGYQLLQELGALNEARELTPLGRDLARLPIDPTLGRMLLQAQREHAVRELLIIAAALSIQDPRERPLDQREAATAAHQRFADPRSDFLTLLNLWNAVHEQWEVLRTQNQRRKFCRGNFLSYVRMREWQDLQAQLQEALAELGNLAPNQSPAGYDAIHRSILAGLLGHVSQRTERNLYKGAANRQVMIFPGSSLFERVPKAKAKSARDRRGEPRVAASSQPEWLVAGELVETSQLFARTVAAIEASWIVDLAPHLCKVTVQNPHWSPTAGRVLAEEKITLYGLEVSRRKVAYGNINPQEATGIFIRSALVEDALFPEPQSGRREPDESKLSQAQLLANATVAPVKRPPFYSFLDHNRRLRQKIETWQTRSRRHDLVDLDRALAEFYGRHLESVSSIPELNRLLRERTDPDFLCARESDLVGAQDLSYDAQAFPEAVVLENHSVPLSYAYSPGEEHDGVTVKLDQHLLPGLSPATVEWSVPGLREALVSELLRALPKALRRELMPLGPKVAEIVRELRPSGPSLTHDLAQFIRHRYGIDISAKAWPADSIPPHLRPRVELIGPGQKTLATGRDLGQLRAELEKVPIKPAPEGERPEWRRLAEKWERFGLTGWTFGDLPERLPLEHSSPPARSDEAAPQAPRLDFAWPGLEMEDGQVNLRLFRTEAAARQASVGGLRQLAALALQRDLAWLQKDLAALARLAPWLNGFCSVEELQAGAFEHLKDYLLPSQPFPALVEARFRAELESARRRLPGLAGELIDRLEVVLKLRSDILHRYGPAPAPVAKPVKAFTDLKPPGARVAAPGAGPHFVASELAILLPKNFLETTAFERLTQLPRYLKALLTRAERARLNPVKDQERARQIAPYQQALQQLRTEPSVAGAGHELEEFRWMLEEFKVSLFAQELGTAVPVSPKRLDQHLARIRGLGV